MSQNIKRMRSLVMQMPEVATKLQVGFLNSRSEEPKNLTEELAELVSIPLFCPKCGRPITSDFEKRTFKHVRHCSRCQAEYETNMVTAGEWDKLISERKFKYLLDKLDHQVEEVKEWIRSNKTVYAASGKEKETWTSDHEQFAQGVLDHLANIRTHLVRELESSRPCQRYDDSESD